VAGGGWRVDGSGFRVHSGWRVEGGGKRIAGCGLRVEG
jgi:hypothetical protein